MKQIIIGAISALLISSSLYVWNSNTFTKEQKIFLLICIIFPPAQWIGILIILIYNNNKLENTPEKQCEKKVIENKKKLNSSIDNLFELKERGILTIDEYNDKVNKIEYQKIEDEIKNSSEYKQLKSLFDNNILTRDEFENKIKLLRTDELFNSILKRNKLENSDSFQIVYRETTDNELLKIISQNNTTIGAKVFINEKPAPDNTYIYKTKTHKIIVKNGKIIERYFLETFNDYLFEKKFGFEPQIGDKIYKLNVAKVKYEKVNDGKFKYSFFKSYFTENGIIIK